MQRQRRPPETLADYLAIAVCPFLIFLLVASMMFFLVEVFHEGEYKWRLQFVMAMFCMAIVCIARIAMEEGTSYASLFALPLGAVVAFAIMRLVPGGFMISWPLMGIVWWAAHKLTWDCTLVDDKQDASGQGLLQEMGLDPLAAGVPRGPAGTTTRPLALEATTSAAAEDEKSWWEKLLEPDRRPHAPGVWVVYFSLAALPLFGIGGWFVTEPETRTKVFQYLVVYVASGLGLLLATSFAGLRKYLRQRNLEMPADMTATWVSVGAVLIVATLLLAAILPRTRAEHSLSQVPAIFTSAVRQASNYALGPDGTSDDSNDDAATTDAQDDQTSDQSGGKKGQAKKGKGDKSKSKSKGDGQGKGAQGGGQSQGGKSSSQNDQSQNQNQADQTDSSKGEKSSGKNEQSKSGETSGEQERSDENPAEQPDNSGEGGEPEAQSEAQQPPESQSPSFPEFNVGSTIFWLMKWLFWLALLVGGLIAGWYYREQLAAAWQKLLVELREFWARWFGGQPQPQAAIETGPVVAPPRPFAAFADPFASGEAARMSWPELVRYTFSAVEAWGREQGCPRHADQTPHEFAQSLAAVEPQIAAPVRSLAGWYGQLAYAPRAASQGAAEPLRQLWRNLRASAPPAAGL